MTKSKEIRARRLKYAIPGFFIGVAAAIGIRWLVGGGFAAFEALMAGLAVAGWALWYGEKFSSLPTADDVAIIRLREEMSPIGLNLDAHTPVTLKTGSEKKSKL